MSKKIVSDLFISLKNPVESLKCALSFSKLTEQERFYAYYFQKAAWEGSKMNMFQRSYETPGLILLVHTFFFQQNFEEIKQKAFQSVGEESWNYFAAYCAGIFGNLGNFRGFGDMKFIPQVSQEQFQQILELNQGKYATYITQIWERVKKNVYDSSVTLIDFPQNNGVNSFYSPNIKQEEAQLVTDFLKGAKAAEQAINSRLWKIQNELILKIPSLKNHLLNVTGLEKEQEYQNRKIKVQTGDFDFIVQRVVNYLSQVLPYVANETQQNLIREYIKHFVTGDINLHKESQKYWVKDKGPVVETMIGFIENYTDPLHIRADFEAFVAIVNKDRSKAYAKVVDMAQQILEQFPWSRLYEKEEFKAPDFTGLDVVTFASQSVPIGIHIPNYHDICESYGSKNVVLENNMPIITAKNSDFIKEEDLKIYIEEGQTALGLNVALHELIGHGSGRLLQEKQEGEQITLNFDVNTLIDPVSNTHVQTWYKIGENYETVFGKFKSAFEECRAESTALYQSCFPIPYPAFDITDEQRMQKICFTLWLNMVYSGIKGLKFYNVENKS